MDHSTKPKHNLERHSKQEAAEKSLLSVYDGMVRIGSIIDHGPRMATDAFDAKGALLGQYLTRKDAFRAVSRAFDDGRRA